MIRVKTVNEYILNAGPSKDVLLVLRDILNSTELEETIKWGAPCYTYHGKNVVGMGTFKSYTGLWFYQGALLNDKAGVLLNAQDDRTKALRQWRFGSVEDIDDQLLLQYVAEAIENERQNRKVEVVRDKPLVLPDELAVALNESAELNVAFQQFTPGRQREFAGYVAEAKQEKTRRARLDKVIPLILDNIGLNDKYRK